MSCHIQVLSGAEVFCLLFGLGLARQRHTEQGLSAVER